jgi:two-component system cell cycle sensor histidine kinase/response regulator CckA
MVAHPGLVRLVLADMAMPRMDGGELAERIRDRFPRLPVVLMAGAQDPHVEKLLQGYADVPFLPKPISLGKLAELLIDFLGPAPSPEPRSMHQATAHRRGSGTHRVE